MSDSRVVAGRSNESMDPAEIEQFIARNLSWNYFALTFDWVFFVFALSLVSSTTVMPAFAQRLGASNLVIGAIPATSTLGFLLPGIFAANYVEHLPLKLPFVMRYTFWERGPLALVAVIAFFFAQSHGPYHKTVHEFGKVSFP